MTAWNWCPHCKQLVDADDVHDGSEVRCLGCDRWYVCVSFGDGAHWELHPVDGQRMRGTS